MKTLVNLLNKLCGNRLMVIPKEIQEIHNAVINKAEKDSLDAINNIYAFTGCSYEFATLIYKNIRSLKDDDYDFFMKYMKDANLILAGAEEIHVSVEDMSGTTHICALYNINEDEDSCSYCRWFINKRSLDKNWHNDFPYSSVNKMWRGIECM